MAIVLDINCLCEKIIDVDIVEKLLYYYKIKIKSISSIESWLWDGEKRIDSLEQVKAVVDKCKIAIIQLEKKGIKDLGIYIEKISQFYLYTFWINTEGYEMLDCEVITEDNKKFYNEIYSAVIKVENATENIFEIIGIGLETDFYYDDNIEGIICNSRNMVAWLTNNETKIENVKADFKECQVEGLRMKVFQKVL